MAIFQKASLTEYGINRIAQAHSGERMVFTTIGIGDGYLPGELSGVTALANEKQRFSITNSKVQGDTFWAECRTSGIEDPNGIFVRELGLYIADPEHESDRDYDKLYSVAGVIQVNNGDPDFYVFLAQNPENMLVDYRFALHTIISTKAAIIINQKIEGNIFGFAIENGDLILYFQDNMEPPNFLIDQDGYLIAEVS
jgi:hypothetical protein